MEVLGSAVQQDGPSASLTAPNGSSQRRLIESVSRAITDTNGIPSLEAHGTGTALGDPIEVCYHLMSIQYIFVFFCRLELLFALFVMTRRLYSARL